MLIIEKLQAVFNQLNSQNIHLLKEVYSDNIIFEDPLHRICGINNFINYCTNLYSTVSSCKFIFTSSIIVDKTAFLEWDMHLVHPRLNKGNPIIVKGISKIIFEEKVVYHHDYFDLGQMLYEQLICIGFIIKKIKSKLTQ